MRMVLNDLFDYNLKIYQSPNNFKFSLDSILLAEYVKLFNNTQEILDLCTGNAAIPLILTTKTKAHIDAFEVQKSIYDLAYKSIIYNNKNEQITLYNADIKEIEDFIKNKKYDIITCNPPYFKVANKKSLNDNDTLSIARHEVLITLEDIFKIVRSHLNSKGIFYLVHRVNRLDEIIILANKYKVGVKEVTLINTKEFDKPYIALVKCVKDAKMGVIINNPININNRKTYQNIFKEEL